MFNYIRLLLVLTYCLSAISQERVVVSDLKVQGNKKLKTTFIKRISNIKSGHILDSLIIDQDIIRLKRLPAVSHAYYQVFHSHDNHYNVFYNIEENITLNPQLNIYTTNDDEFAYRLGLYDFNAIGRHITFGGFYQKDIFDSYGVNLRAPFIFTNKIGLAVNFQNLTTEEPVFLNEGTASYKYNNTSLEVLGLYTFDFRHRIEAGLTLFNEDYQYLSGATSPDVPRSLRVDKYLLKFIYEYNRLDYYYQYISGFRSVLYVQSVASKNPIQEDFFIAWNDFYYYKRIGDKGNWANRLRLGLATNSNSPFAPFSLDNNLNIRGVGNIIDRGTGVIVLNTEYRHTLFEKKWFVLQGNVFSDIGSWRNPGGNYSDFIDDENFRIYPGLGLRFIHKEIFNAIFRIDYGYGIIPNSSNGFVFGIGQYF